MRMTVSVVALRSAPPPGRTFRGRDDNAVTTHSILKREGSHAPGFP
jgi:hypothetical protein